MGLRHRPSGLITSMAQQSLGRIGLLVTGLGALSGAVCDP